MQHKLIQYDPLNFMFFLYNLQFLKSELHLTEQLFRKCGYDYILLQFVVFCYNDFGVT